MLREQWYIMRLYDRVLQNRIAINAPKYSSPRKATNNGILTQEEVRKCIDKI